ncbi:hypothetical protein [Sphingomonas albertensis]|uniref:Uncharacterized protein n=1 Tax=Sphingomonas albertensis TaxID=2762591 RepID=A0ABR7ASA5_9SPHN|nr:hypothetical protein [Sphingomonas albertensis]MBC3943341.1 hypothetical protein [Sphingomonas albertensis]
MAHRIIMEFKPNGWQAKEDELYRLIVRGFEAVTEQASHPCKSGEGADLAVWCAREAEAQRAEGNSSPHTAKPTRESRYDDQGVMPVAIAAARIALALTPDHLADAGKPIDATQTREAETRNAIVRDLIAERRSYKEDSPTWRAFGFCIDIAEKAALNARGGA